MKKNNIFLKIFIKYIIKFFVIYIWILIIGIGNIIITYIKWYSFDVGINNTILLIIIYEFLISLLILFIYYIFFNIIYKIKVKNKNLFLLILFTSLLILLLPSFGDIDSFLIPIWISISFWLYWYYLKIFKKK